MSVRLLAASFFSLLTATAAAQDSTAGRDLDPVTITSSLTPLAASKTGRNIITIPGERFAQLPVNSVDELLRYLPGVEVQARGPMGTQSNFIIRGGTFQQVLVIMDGLRLNDPLTGHFNSYMPVVPAEIERIEILKGASSALYGSEAVGAVIHIITKAFAAKNTKGHSALVQGVVGEYGLRNISAGGFYNWGSSALTGGVLSNNADGQQLRGGRGFFYLNTASLSFQQKLGNHWLLGVRSGYDHRSFNAQNFYSRSVADTAEETVKSTWNQARLSFNKGRHSWTLNLGHKSAVDEYVFNKRTSANENRSQVWQAQTQYEYRFSPNTTLIGGGQAVQRILKSNNRGDHDELLLAAFVHLNQSWASGFSMAPALRIDHNNRRRTEVVPQLNAAYRLRSFTLRASAGRAVRDADFTERYNNYNRNPVPSGQALGNPELVAETSWNYEGGVDFTPLPYLKISATYFNRDMQNAIDYVVTPYAAIPRKTNLLPTGTYGFAQNIVDVDTRGFETDVQFQRSFGTASSLLVTAGVVWIKTRSSQTATTFYISSHARFLTNFNVAYQYKAVTLALNGLYKERAAQEAAPINATLSPAYFVVNGKLDARVWKQGGSLFIQVDNLLDRTYSDILGAQMPGRWVMGGFKFVMP